MDDHKKMTYNNFQIFLKISLAVMVEIIDSFETNTINSLIKKKIFETNFIMSRALFWVAQLK